MTKKDSAALYEECCSALEAYVREARRTCDLLLQIQEQALSGDKRRILCAQREMENEAHRVFLELRERFLGRVLAANVSPARALSAVAG